MKTDLKKAIKEDFSETKEDFTQFAKGTAKVTGVAYKKALVAMIPPEVLHNSSFFGGLVRLGDAIANAGSESKEGGKKSKQYVVRHSGGAVADVAIGTLFLGMPVTFVSALLSDGLKVASHVLKGAETQDKSAEQLGDFFGDLSVVSNNFMKLFDIPSKETAADVRGSIEKTMKRLEKEGKLSEKMKHELTELENMSSYEVKNAEQWFEDVQKKLCSIVECELEENKLDAGEKDIKSFLEHPSMEGMETMRDSMIHDLNQKGINVKSTSMTFIDNLIDSLNNLSKEDFHNKMRSAMAKHYEMMDRTEEALGDSAYLGYKLVYSVANLTHKGAMIFGRHYKKQITTAVEKHQEESLQNRVDKVMSKHEASLKEKAKKPQSPRARQGSRAQSSPAPRGAPRRKRRPASR